MAERVRLDDNEWLNEPDFFGNCIDTDEPKFYGDQGRESQELSELDLEPPNFDDNKWLNESDCFNNHVDMNKPSVYGDQERMLQRERDELGELDPEPPNHLDDNELLNEPDFFDNRIDMNEPSVYGDQGQMGERERHELNELDPEPPKHLDVNELLNEPDFLDSRINMNGPSFYGDQARMLERERAELGELDPEPPNSEDDRDSQRLSIGSGTWMRGLLVARFLAQEDSGLWRDVGGDGVEDGERAVVGEAEREGELDPESIYKDDRESQKLSPGSGTWMRGLLVARALAEEGGGGLEGRGDGVEEGNGDVVGEVEREGEEGEDEEDAENGEAEVEDADDAEDVEEENESGEAEVEGVDDAEEVEEAGNVEEASEEWEQVIEQQEGSIERLPSRQGLSLDMPFTIPYDVRKNHLRMCLSCISVYVVAEVLMVVAVGLLVLLLASCTSTATSRFYLLSLTENTASNSTAQSLNSPMVVRIGYFSLCVLQSADSWLCSSDTTSLIRQFGREESDPAGIFALAIGFKDNIASSGLILASLICVCIAFLTCKRPVLVALKLHPRDECTTFKTHVLWDDIRNALAIMAICSSALFAMLAIVWQNVTVMAVVRMMGSMAGTPPSASMGVASMVLGWATFGVTAVTAVRLYLGITFMQGRGSAEHDVESTAGNTCPIHGPRR